MSKEVRTNKQVYDSSERFVGQPRISSMHSRLIYDEIVDLSKHINFAHPRFAHRHKRCHSLGSVQAFIVEIALTNSEFLQYLKKFMVNEGRGYTPQRTYRDIYE